MEDMLQAEKHMMMVQNLVRGNKNTNSKVEHSYLGIEENDSNYNQSQKSMSMSNQSKKSKKNKKK